MTYTIKDGFDQMDFDHVTEMIASSYWAPGVSKQEMLKCSENSALVVGAFSEDGAQVGFARVVSDKTRFCFIMDVMVDEPFRKQGIGQAMIDYILQHNNLSDVYFWTLMTKDAHGMYQKLGFKALEHPEQWMIIHSPRPER